MILPTILLVNSVKPSLFLKYGQAHEVESFRRLGSPKFQNVRIYGTI